ncbi:MAG: hypothetical protein ONA90_00335, partial [candidate division KSB1 bacterium]|nr:hypothetical protein [candidate division KSB1 bacterium]
VDLTGLPDANVELVGENWAAYGISPLTASPYGLHLASDSLHYEKPFSRIDYSKGPFSADAVRVRFGRALSRRLTTYLNGTFCNSEGQFVNLPYDGHKVSLQFDYRLTSKSRLRYRHFHSRNEVGVGVPFFPEEWPGITSAFHKEERLYHELDGSFRNKIGLRAFVWQVKEELNDPATQVRHRLRDGGAELEWREQTARWAFNFRNRIGLEQIQSWSIENHQRFYNQVSATAAARFAAKMWLHLSGHYAYKADWLAGIALEAKWIAAPTPSLTLWVAGGLGKLPPALGERDNQLPYLSQNENLQAADLRRSEVGLHWQRPHVDLKLRVSGSNWPNGFIFQIDSLRNTGFLVNRSG